MFYLLKNLNTRNLKVDSAKKVTEILVHDRIIPLPFSWQIRLYDVALGWHILYQWGLRIPQDHLILTVSRRKPDAIQNSPSPFSVSRRLHWATRDCQSISSRSLPTPLWLGHSGSARSSFPSCAQVSAALRMLLPSLRRMCPIHLHLSNSLC